MRSACPPIMYGCKYLNFSRSNNDLELLARRTRVPVTVYTIPCVIPLVPGSGIYWTAFYVVTNDLERAGARGFLTLKDAVAIVLGILFVFEIPQSWFRKVLTDKNK